MIKNDKKKHMIKGLTLTTDFISQSPKGWAVQASFPTISTAGTTYTIAQNRKIQGQGSKNSPNLVP